MITDVESPATLLCYVSQLLKRSVPENFQQGNFLGLVPTESLRTQDSENVYVRWVQQIFDPVLVARSWVSATKWGPLAKL